MPKTAILRARVDPEKKAAAEAVFDKIGISLSDAISLFLSQVDIQQGIPFPLTALQRLDLTNATVEEIEQRYAARIQTPETRAALSEDTRRAKRYKSPRRLINSLRANA